ncbi:MAG: Fe-S cluster assembly sulfur transfer protein SufU [Bacteroidota bacterium]
MDTSKKGLYHPVIMGHNKHPFHFEKKEEASVIIEAYNQLCGDQFKLYLDLDGDKILQAHFHGYGCAVSKASTSLLVQQLEKRRIEDVKILIDKYLNMLKGEGEELVEQSPWDELSVFKAAQNYPARMKCATLCWEEIQRFIDTK